METDVIPVQCTKTVQLLSVLDIMLFLSSYSLLFVISFYRINLPE